MAIRTKTELVTTPEQLAAMSLDELRDIYRATKGIVFMVDTKEKLLAVLVKKIATLKHYV